MRMSQLFMQTLREPPADVGLPGYQLLLRGGFVRSPSAGSHAFLPLGVAVRARVQQDARRVLSDMGGQEVALPTVQPADSAKHAPRTPTPEWAVSLQHAVQLSGERHRNWHLCGSHDRYLMAMAGHVIQSYRQLPTLLYHIWQPLHQEVRPTHGLFDSRETCVVDAYSLHETEADRDDLYQRLFDEFGSLVELADLAALRAVTEVDQAGCRGTDSSGHRRRGGRRLSPVTRVATRSNTPLDGRPS